MKGGLLSHIQYRHLPGTLTRQNHTQVTIGSAWATQGTVQREAAGSNDRQPEAGLIIVLAPAARKWVCIGKSLLKHELQPLPALT